MVVLREPDRLTLVDALAILEAHLPTAEQARSRLRSAFIQKAIPEARPSAFSYDEAEIDWQTGLVKIPRRRDRFCPTFSRADFEAYFFKPPAQPDAVAISRELGISPSTYGALSGPDTSLQWLMAIDLPAESTSETMKLPGPAEPPVAPEKREPIVKLTPTFMGMSLNGNELIRRGISWYRKRREQL